ncbi:MAG: DUF2306 domain-containing protein [Gemmataceae bacterium]|nr:DUF2306 domain-containing protein [Gemmataceae bacterium]
MSNPVRHRILTAALRWLAVALVLRVLAAILLNYPDYFPPNFGSLFLQGREATFTGLYRVAFYAHIVSGPVVLLGGLVLLSGYVRRRYGALHRRLGRVQVAVLLAVMLPSGVVMARDAFGGWPAGLSFLALSAATAGCAVAGVVEARRHRFDRHPRWMLRTYVLICSAVALRLISGAAGLVGVTSPEAAYAVAAWASWLVPLAAYEVAERLPARRPGAAKRPHPPAPSPAGGGGGRPEPDRSSSAPLLRSPLPPRGRGLGGGVSRYSISVTDTPLWKICWRQVRRVLIRLA